MNKIYDDSDEYKRAILSDSIKSSDIMKKITLPKSVYKYRKFDIQHLKASLDGEVFFSNPAEMNVNDSNDCKMVFDEKEILKTMVPKGMDDILLEKLPGILNMLQKYKKSLQGKMRVGCFTTCDCSKREMWDNKHFGDKHKGYCIKYKVEPKYFYPATVVFLKVLYDNKGFDATDAMKNVVEREKLEKNGFVDSKSYQARTVKMVCLGYNHTLLKPKEYQNEDEWRIIIPENRYSEYFGKADIYTRNFSTLMQAIYLGSEFRNADKNGEMYKYALDVCKRIHIPLYVMQRNGDSLEAVMVYSPKGEYR